LVLTSAGAVANFLPSSGTTAALPTGALTNPTTYGNSLAGELVAAKLSVRFDELNVAFSPASALLKNMVVASGTFAGWTVQEVIDEADRKIGGCGGLYTRSSLSSALAAINTGYAGGTTASGYLSCPTARMAEVLPTATVARPALGLRVFPNPANSLTTIEVDASEAPEGELELVIMSANGAVVHQRAFMDAGGSGILREVWDAGAMAPGLYLVMVGGADLHATIRLVVE
jgi:hypothetical protein